MIDFFHKLYREELKILYTSVFIRKIGASLISIFVPIYLYQNDYSIIYILIFFLISSLVYLLWNSTGAHIIARCGEKHAMLFSAPLEISYYVSLILIPKFPIFFVIAPILLGIYTMLFNTSYHLIFTRNSHEQQRGREIATMGILVTLAGIISPYIGGLLAEANFNLLFIVSSLFIFVSSIPLFFTHDTFEKIHFTNKKLYRDIFAKSNKGNFISFSAYGTEHMINLIIWPIFIIITVGTLTKTGLIISITTILSLVSYYFIGRIADSFNHKKMLSFGTYMHAIAWILRLLATTIGSIILIDSFKGIAQKKYSIFLGQQKYTQ